MGRKGNADRIIRASEVGQYLFCARAWWLGAVEERPSANVEEMEAGDKVHRRHGRQVRSSVMLSRLAYLILALAVMAAAIALLRGGAL